MDCLTVMAVGLLVDVIIETVGLPYTNKCCLKKAG